jgi:hypothetical protein
MITEKGISDTNWCEMLWADRSSTDKRVKPERGSNEIMQSLSESLVLQMNSKSALINKLTNGDVEAVPYSNEFWINVPAGDTQLLITIASLKMVWDTDAYTHVIILRKPRYDPRDDKQEKAEHLIQVALFENAMKHFSTNLDIVVQTDFPRGKTVTLEKTSPQEIESLAEWANEMQAMYEGTRSLAPNLSNCSRCWWKECPSRKEDPLLKRTTNTKRIQSM